MSERPNPEIETLGTFAGWLLAAIAVGALLLVLAGLVWANVRAWGSILA